MKNLKIYFAGSIRGGRDDAGIYQQIIEMLKNYGKVLTEHIGQKQLTSSGEAEKTDKYIYTRDVDWIRECDIVVAEVTNPSLGVGYELGFAESLNKKIFCLHRSIEGKKLSAMVSGNSNFKVFEYVSIDDLPAILKQIFAEVL